jgi:transcriptional regulator with GAF, ATPase, and Fis domain
MGASRPGQSDSNSDATVSSDRARRACAPPRVARLVVVYPRALAGSFALADAAVTAGRPGAGVALAIAHPTVSRQHATIRWDPTAGRHSICDLGSRNGTWLDGQPVAALPKLLADGAVVRIGDVLAVYERGDPPAAAPQVSREALPGESLAAQQLRAAVARAGPDPSPALILGETGAGKERVAAELHRLSGRRGPLLALNCAALSAQLVESQLFGHVRGAFTGATGEQAGFFRAAAGGTLFLDELGEMPLELQPKLLRAVESGEVVAVGSTQAHRTNARLVAATNRSLLEDVAKGRFRRDLYARLALCEVPVPPLRARRVDLIEWIDRLHRAWCEQRGAAAAPLEFDVEAMEALLLAPWLDNLRGLNRLVHAVAGQAGPVAREQLPRWLHGEHEEAAEPEAEPRRDQEPSGEGGKRTFRPRPSREELLAALAAHGWSLRATARHFERDRKQIVRWVEMYAIELPRRADD